MSAGDKRGRISAYALINGRISRLSYGVRVIWLRAGVQWCGVFQVVKTA
jgi:hypothetical protein